MTNARFITALRRRYSVFPWEKVPSCSNRKKKAARLSWISPLLFCCLAKKWVTHIKKQRKMTIQKTSKNSQTHGDSN